MLKFRVAVSYTYSFWFHHSTSSHHHHSVSVILGVIVFRQKRTIRKMNSSSNSALGTGNVEMEKISKYASVSITDHKPAVQTQVSTITSSNY